FCIFGPGASRRQVPAPGLYAAATLVEPMNVPSGPGRTARTTSSLPVQALATPFSPPAAIGDAGSFCQPVRGGCAAFVPPQATSRNASALPRPATVARTTSLLTSFSAAGDMVASSGCVGEGVVERVQGSVALYREPEVFARAL